MGRLLEGERGKQQTPLSLSLRLPLVFPLSQVMAPSLSSSSSSSMIPKIPQSRPKRRLLVAVVLSVCIGYVLFVILGDSAPQGVSPNHHHHRVQQQLPNLAASRSSSSSSASSSSWFSSSSSASTWATTTGNHEEEEEEDVDVDDANDELGSRSSEEGETSEEGDE